MIHIFILISIFFAYSWKAVGQDMHFTHFFNTPLITNPAQTGQFDGQWRFTGDYRDQWRSITVPYTTFTASADYQFDLYSFPVDLSAGLFILNDHAGDGDLNTQKVYFMGSASKKLLNEKVTVSLGLAYGTVQQKLDFSKLTFDEQWTLTGFDTDLPSQEPSDEQSQSYSDLNLGVYASYQWDDDILLHGGAAVMHLIQPTSSFYNQQNRLGMRPVFHGGATWDFRDKWTLEPAIQFMQQKKANEFLAGANLHYQLEKNGIEQLTAGAWFRGVGDAIPAVGLTYKGVQGLISYDFNLYDVNEASNTLGGFEISLKYIIPRDESVEQMVIPCIRI